MRLSENKDKIHKSKTNQTWERGREMGRERGRGRGRVDVGRNNIAYAHKYKCNTNSAEGPSDIK